MSSIWERAITVFSSDGHLLQVEFAKQAVSNGSTVVGVRGTDAIVLVVQKKVLPKLQEERTLRKIFLVDDHVMMTFAGLRADGRVLIDRARIECQSYKMSVENPVTMNHISRFIAELQHTYTHTKNLRPFGVSFLIGGFDEDGQPHLYETEPSGVYFEWKANAIGKSAETARKFLEKHYTVENVSNVYKTVKLAIRALLEVLPSTDDLNNLEIAVMRRNEPIQILDTETIERYMTITIRERE